MEKGVIFSNKDGVFKRLPNGAIIPYKDENRNRENTQQTIHKRGNRRDKNNSRLP